MKIQREEVQLETLIEGAFAPDGVVLGTLQTAFPEALAVYAFGSRIQGNAHADSDLDLAVLVPGYADPLGLWDLASELCGQLGCAVDLLDLRAASTVMQYQVVTTGRRLWGKPLEAGLFECFVLSEKLALNEARGSLIQDIQKEGKVYGR